MDLGFSERQVTSDGGSHKIELSMKRFSSFLAFLSVNAILYAKDVNNSRGLRGLNIGWPKVTLAFYADRGKDHYVRNRR